MSIFQRQNKIMEFKVSKLHGGNFRADRTNYLKKGSFTSLCIFPIYFLISKNRFTARGPREAITLDESIINQQLWRIKWKKSLNLNPKCIDEMNKYRANKNCHLVALETSIKFDRLVQSVTKRQIEADWARSW